MGGNYKCIQNFGWKPSREEITGFNCFEIWVFHDNERSSRDFYGLWHRTVMWRWSQQGPSKCWYPTATLHCVTVRKNSTWNVTAVKSSNLVTSLHLSCEMSERNRGPTERGISLGYVNINLSWYLLALHQTTFYGIRNYSIYSSFRDTLSFSVPEFWVIR